MWYHAALSLMLVEITPRTFAQIGCMVCIYIMNAIFNAILFGVYFDLLVAAREKQKLFQETLDNADTAMNNLSIPFWLNDKVRNYIL